ncbi:PH domain-containing protein [Lineolata rhizophorae]|uniref:PH domain-containing protein n=1 Tax=Lineolata rhizophorae TaxID=578093 RepID=A0A6A6NMB7_9PEZI|nr:PH domain-containing protein [Lineolata rhizophorae]
MSSPTESLPRRTTTMGTDDDAVPGEDTSEVTKLMLERLQAFKHAVGYIEDYITATEKAHNSHGKEYERVLKTVSHPLKEGHHFDQQLGGIAGMFDNIRSNTQGIANSHHETAKTLKGSVLPMFERLHAEIKNKSKELNKGAGKQSKTVDKARNTTQKHIELLGQHTATFDSTGGKMSAADDPYVLQRGVYHRLNKQVVEENNNRQDLLSVQDSLKKFEAHVIEVIQQGLGSFNQVVSGQAEQTRAMYGNIVATAHAIPPDFEWKGFIARNEGVLINPDNPPRTVSSISFPNQDHRATQPVIAGALERKSKMLRRYETAYYALTPAKYLHEFKTDDDFGREPTPELSLYLPDCVVGAIDGTKFHIKGKDVSKGKVGNTFSMSHELQFKAHTPSDAQQWWDAIRAAAGQVTAEQPPPSEPTSPEVARKESQPTSTDGSPAPAAAAAETPSAEKKEPTEPAEPANASTAQSPTNGEASGTGEASGSGGASGPPPSWSAQGEAKKEEEKKTEA